MGVITTTCSKYNLDHKAWVPEVSMMHQINSVYIYSVVSGLFDCLRLILHKHLLLLNRGSVLPR